MRGLRHTAAVLLVGALALGACGSGGTDGDPAAFCDRLDRLTRNDPFAAFGDVASEAEMALAFTALRERAEALVEVAPPEARPAARDYRDAVVGLDELLAAAGYGTDVDTRAYRDQTLAYAAAARRLERHLAAEC